MCLSLYRLWPYPSLDSSPCLYLLQAVELLPQRAPLPGSSLRAAVLQLGPAQLASTQRSSARPFFPCTRALRLPARRLLLSRAPWWLSRLICGRHLQLAGISSLRAAHALLAPAAGCRALCACSAHSFFVCRAHEFYLLATACRAPALSSLLSQAR
uniref:Uncharacterized protein n=1 Tax=Zea mays TaxID=4577 RepID=B4FMX2_MAIZE|nr:unknown [Zea mays]|eukprot:NP_001140267.1 uncharacterized protein LOC100272311 [Zea mays]